MTRSAARTTSSLALGAGNFAPLDALASRSRRAIWWRRIARRVLAAILVLIALAVLASRLTAQSAAGGGTDRPSDAGAAGEQPDGSRATGSAGASHSTAQDVPRPGSRSVPAGTIGLSLPAVDAATVARLAAGDRVDVYAVGARTPVASGARVLDVTLISPYASPDTPPLPYEPSSALAPTVFVAVKPTEVGQITAGQHVDSPARGFLFAVHPRSAAGIHPAP